MSQVKMRKAMQTNIWSPYSIRYLSVGKETSNSNRNTKVTASAKLPKSIVAQRSLVNMVARATIRLTIRIHVDEA